jgi:hypothetical protein
MMLKVVIRKVKQKNSENQTFKLMLQFVSASQMGASTRKWDSCSRFGEVEPSFSLTWVIRNRSQRAIL